jgi:hypothetical protein
MSISSPLRNVNVRRSIVSSFGQSHVIVQMLLPNDATRHVGARDQNFKYPPLLLVMHYHDQLT